MGNPSEWAQEVKKGLFWIFQIFFRKIMAFQWKNEHWPKMVKKSRKSSETCSRHNFLLFLWYESIKTGFFCFFGRFLNFLLFFTNLHSRQDLGWQDPLKSMFFTWFWLLTFQTSFWSPNLIRLYNINHSKKCKTCFLGLPFSEKNQFCSDSLEIKNKGHFSHWKNLNFHNLRSNFKKRHFLDPLESILAIFGSFLTISALGVQFKIIILAKLWVGHKI